MSHVNEAATKKAAVKQMIRSHLLTLLSLSAVVLGCHRGTRDDAFGGIRKRAQTGDVSTQSVELRISRTIGKGAAPTFTILGPIAALDDGALAVADLGTCQVVVIPKSSAETVRRISRCGDGPGELREIAGLTSVGDTLIVYDPTKQAVLWITQDGFERRRLRPDILRDSAAMMGLSSIAIASDTVLVVGLLLPPSDEARSDDRLLAMVDTRTGRTIRRFLSDPVVSQRNHGILLRSAEFCVVRTDSGAFLSAINRWAFEGVTWRIPELQETGHFMVPLSWTGPIHVERDPPGVMRPASAYSTVGCTQQGVFFRQHRTDQTNKPVKILGGHIEFRDFTGKLLYASDLAVGDPLLSGLYRAGTTNSVYLATSDPETSEPIVREIEVLRGNTTALQPIH